MNGSEPLLSVRNLRVEYATRSGTVYAVDGVDLDVHAGEAVAVVGESGSGKSATVMAVAQLLDRSGHVASGSIVFDGRDITNLTRKERRGLHGREIGVVFQNPLTSLDPLFRVGYQITEGLQSPGRRMRGTRAVELLTRVRVPDPARVARSYPHQLSGGMRQRSSVAGAVAATPRLLIADEPTTALDVTVQAQILALIEELRRSLGMALILVSHDLSVVSQHCDTVNVMYAGKIVERASTTALFADPRHPYTRGLLRAIPEFDGPTKPLRAIPGAPPDQTTKHEGCPFAPRCERRLEVCDVAFPGETIVEGSHSLWCHNP